MTAAAAATREGRTRIAATEPVNSLNEPRPAAFPATTIRKDDQEKTVTRAAAADGTTYGTGQALFPGLPRGRACTRGGTSARPGRRGLSNAEIAATLVFAESTVKTRVQNMPAKLGLPNRGQLTIAAYDSGLIQPRGHPPHPG